MDAGAWFRLVQLFIVAGGLVAVFLTLWQKLLSDNRAEWWKRFTWAVENANNENQHMKRGKQPISSWAISTTVP